MSCATWNGALLRPFIVPPEEHKKFGLVSPLELVVEYFIDRVTKRKGNSTSMDLSQHLANLPVTRLRQIARKLDLDTDGTREDIAARLEDVVDLEDLAISDLRTLARRADLKSTGSKETLIRRLNRDYEDESESDEEEDVRVVRRGRDLYEEAAEEYSYRPRASGKFATLATLDDEVFLESRLAREEYISDPAYDIAQQNLIEAVRDETQTCITTCIPKEKPVIFNVPQQEIYLPRLVRAPVPADRLSVVAFPYGVSIGELSELRDVAETATSMCYSSESAGPFADGKYQPDFAYILIDRITRRPLASVITVAALPGSKIERTAGISKMCTHEDQPRLGKIYVSTLLRKVLPHLRARGFVVAFTYVPKTEYEMQPEEILANAGFRRVLSDDENVSTALMVKELVPSRVTSELFAIEGPSTSTTVAVRQLADIILRNINENQLVKKLLPTAKKLLPTAKSS